jgi:hypothetical protein
VKLFRKIRDVVFGSSPPLVGWKLVLDDKVVGVIGESVYWDVGYQLYRFLPDLGFGMISSFVDQARAAREAGNDELEDSAYAKQRELEFLLRSPAGEEFSREDFDLYFERSDEVQIKLSHRAWDRARS